jgi:hypothetical protein
LFVVDLFVVLPRIKGLRGFISFDRLRMRGFVCCLLLEFVICDLEFVVLPRIKGLRGFISFDRLRMRGFVCCLLLEFVICDLEFVV